jgi:LAO/AO transport system kinase
VARLVSLVEDGSDQLREVMALLAPLTGHTHVVGITGAPGVGKSTTTDALLRCLRARGQRVGVLAVDPSSPFTGGALLGDRVRMQEHATDPGVYIRSMATRGHLGGLAAATPQALRVLDAAGFDVVVVETVGVGQSEVEVAASADTVVVLVAPGMGDAVQAAKAGILEIGDVYVVNKADRDGADLAARELHHMLGLAPGGPTQRPVLRTVAATGEGVEGLLAAIDEHRASGLRTGQLTARRTERAAGEVVAVAMAMLARHGQGLDRGSDLDRLAADVAAGRSDPYRAADELLAGLAPAPVSAVAMPTVPR